MIRFFAGPFGTLAFYVIVIAAIVAGFFGWLFMHDSALETQAALRFNKTQLEQVVKDNEAFQQRMSELTGIAQDLAKRQEELFSKLDESNDRIKEIVKSKNFKDFNEQAPETVKETLRQLRAGTVK